MLAILISNLLRFAIPIGLFIWSLFCPTIAGYIFVGISIVFEGYIFYADIIGKPKPDPLLWTPDEIEIIRKYHLAIRFPWGANDMSSFLNGIRWSSILWVPWLLWNQMWFCGVFLIVNFFITSSISVRLAPYYYLSDAVNRGQFFFNKDLTLLKAVTDKINRIKE